MVDTSRHMTHGGNKSASENVNLDLKIEISLITTFSVMFSLNGQYYEVGEKLEYPRETTA